MLLNMRLGLRVVPTSSAVCQLCGEPLDPFGDHPTCCRKTNLTARHNGLAGALGRVLTAAGLSVTPEVRVRGKLRPADLMITGWSWPKRDAVDLTVVNPMAEFDNPKANKKVALAEEAKHRKYDTLCAAENVNMNALGFSVLGGAGPETQKFLASLRERLLQAHGETEGKQLAREAL